MRVRTAIVATATSVFLSAAALSTPTTHYTLPPSTPTPTTAPAEDDPSWRCNLHGNRRCAPATSAYRL
jgi:hypothetical protein